MKKNLLPAIAILAVASCAQVHADTIADWTFETTQPATSGPFSPEVGTGAASGSHASGAAVYSTPAGNGSTHSFSSNNWAANDYYQFQVSTLNFDNITLSYDQNGSNTGPVNFELAYSTDGTNFTDFSTYKVPTNGTTALIWSAGTPVPASTLTFDLSSIDDLANDASVTFRIIDTSATAINGSAVGTAGTDRVDNVIVSGTAEAAPEPSSWALTGLAVGTFAFLRRRMAGSNL
jgi:hypothetical protein